MRKRFFLLSFLSCVVFANGNNATTKFDADTLTFKKIYNFQVGDVFQYVDEFSSSAGGAYPTYRNTTKYSIISKDVSGDTLKYDISGIVKSEFWCEGQVPTCVYTSSSRKFNDIHVYIDSNNHYLNQPKDSLVTGFNAQVSAWI